MGFHHQLLHTIVFCALSVAHVLFSDVFGQITSITWEVDTAFSAPAPLPGSEPGSPAYNFDEDNLLNGNVTYRVFANFTNPTDVFVAMYSIGVGDEITDPLLIHAPCGCYNTPDFGVFYGANLNTAFFTIAPELAYDSYLTLGNSGIMATPNISSSYNNDTGFCDMSVDDGAFVMNGGAGIACGEDLQIELFQITTCGAFEFHACFQVFPEGDFSQQQFYCMSDNGGSLVVENPCLTTPTLSNACVGLENIGVQVEHDTTVVSATLWSLDGDQWFPVQTSDAGGPFMFDAASNDSYYVTTVDAIGCPDTTDVFQGQDFIACTDSCGTPIISSPDLEYAPSGMAYAEACPSGSIEVDGSASTGTGSGSLEYHWTLGTTSFSTQEPITELPVPDAPGVYPLILEVSDANNCNAPTSDTLTVFVSPIPELQFESNSPVCAGSDAYIQVTSITSTPLTSTAFDAGYSTSLPDAFNVPYESVITLSDFPDDATIESCSGVIEVTAILEHTFIGDLTISIECPNGQEVLLLDNGASGAADPSECMYPDLGGNNLGLPMDGIGWEYTWSMDGEFIIDDPENPAVFGGAAVPAGDYLPCGDYCEFIGCPINGDWTLRILDQWLGDDGQLFDWSLGLNPALVSFDPSGMITASIGSVGWDEGLVLIDFNDTADSLWFSTDEPGLYDVNFNTVNSFGCYFNETFTVNVVESPNIYWDVDPFYTTCGGGVLLENEFLFDASNDYIGCELSGGTDFLCYGNNTNDVISLCPDVPGDGTMMTLTFTGGEVESFFDQIQIFDGPSTADSLIAEINQELTGYSFQATNPSGCLTMQVVSDISSSCESGQYAPIAWCTSCAVEPWAACTEVSWAWEPAEWFGEEADVQEPLLDLALDTTLSVTGTLTLTSPSGVFCQTQATTTVGPPAFEGTIQMPSCLDNGNGTVTYTLDEPVQGAVQIFVNNVFDQWLNGETAFVVGPLPAGTHTVTGYDLAQNCLFADQFTLDLTDINADADVLCAISIDPESQLPVLQWSPNEQNTIDYWKLFRMDAEQGGWYEIATLNNTGINIYTDVSGTPWLHAERYNLMAYDPCGAYIDVQPEARTTFLTGSIGFNGVVNLHWTDLAPADAHYHIQRSVDEGDFTTIGQIIGQHDFSDPLPPLDATSLRYRIAQFGPFGTCTEAIFSNEIGASMNWLSASSLADAQTPIGISQLGPGSRHFTLSLTPGIPHELTVTDTRGRSVDHFAWPHTTSAQPLHLPSLPSGLYLLNLRNAAGVQSTSRFFVE